MPLERLEPLDLSETQRRGQQARVLQEPSALLSRMEEMAWLDWWSSLIEPNRRV